jgi:stage V sporulation protein K
MLSLNILSYEGLNDSEEDSDYKPDSYDSETDSNKRKNRGVERRNLRKKRKVNYSYHVESENDIEEDIGNKVVLPKRGDENEPEYPLNKDLTCIPFTIGNFSDLYLLASICADTERPCMFKDCQILPKLWPVLQEIQELIGLTTVKNALCDMIMYEILSDHIEKQKKNKGERYWRHMVITGPPGTGKTTVAKIIARLLNKIGKTSSDEIVVGNRRNMISDWQGQTKSMVDALVQKAVNSSGIILIDEAPNLNDGRDSAAADSYSKSCLDTLMELMDAHKDDLIIILAGYRNEMEKNIMSVNKGMRRRIQWWFDIAHYTPEEMFLIFKKQIVETGYTLPLDLVIDNEWFNERETQFPFSGGSVRNFVEKICTVQVKKMFGQVKADVLTNSTLLEAYELYKTFSLSPGIRV